MKAFSLSIVVLLCAGLIHRVEGDPVSVVYVDDDAPQGGDGGSWSNAFCYLQDALADADSLPRPVEVRVAQGVYRPDQGQASVAGDRSATFRLVDGAILKGGYAGLGQPDPNARDVALHETILSGDLLGDDQDDAPGFEDNSHYVVKGRALDEPSEIDGFTITGGFGRDGSGMHIETSTLTVSNCLFANNQNVVFHGVLRCSKSDATLINCTFEGNRGGSGIRVDRSNVLLRGCEIVGHDWDGLAAEYSDVRIVDCNFHENGWSGIDGGLTGNLIVERSRFVGNEHGGIVAWGTVAVESSWFEDNSEYGAIFNPDGLIARTCTFANNVGLAGAVSPASGLTLLEQCRFSGNAGTFASAVHVGNGLLRVSECLFTGNLGRFEGPVISTGAPTTLTNCTFHGHENSRTNQTSAIVDAHSLANRVHINQCIMRGGNPIEAADPNLVWVSHSNISGGWPGPGNIDEDPCFVNPGYWVPADDPDLPDWIDDLYDEWIDGDYHLKSQAGRWDPVTETWVQDNLTSPCIDTGDPKSPLGHEPFPNGGRINMGAYGGTAEASKTYFGGPPCETIIAGDLNGDCRVDQTDFAILAGQWLRSEGKTAPVVQVVQPADGATLGAYNAQSPIRIRADAEDSDGVVRRVEYTITYAEPGQPAHQTVLVDEDRSDGWAVDWYWWGPEGALPEGHYTIAAEATDNDGLVGTAPQITIRMHGPK